jgi:hypothetical protein
MAVVTPSSTVITNLDAKPIVKAEPADISGRVRVAQETIEVTAGDSATSTYRMVRIPSNAVILAASKLYMDDIGGANLTVADIGLRRPGTATDVTADPDALNTGLDASNVGTLDVLSDHALMGQKAWQYVAGLTKDPGGSFDVYITLGTADAAAGGTMTLELQYVID